MQTGFIITLWGIIGLGITGCAKSSPTTSLPQHIHHEKYLAASPPKVWPWVTEPTMQARWSHIQIDLVQAGPDGRADSKGSIREVTLQVAGVAKIFREKVIRSQPPHQFEYQVITGDHDHIGRIQLTPSGQGTLLIWDIDLDVRRPKNGIVLHSTYQKKLGQDLDTLATMIISP